MVKSSPTFLTKTIEKTIFSVAYTKEKLYHRLKGNFNRFVFYFQFSVYDLSREAYGQVKRVVLLMLQSEGWHSYCLPCCFACCRFDQNDCCAPKFRSVYVPHREKMYYIPEIS